ncbi:MAG: hypothetical protein K0S38_594 [Candidatus Paceibacter sp.]|jgi:hypothetical protein|nr:hypothetical protein [Candidatus Paceibacter sp.]
MPLSPIQGPVPEKGFYYHYKHNPEKGIYDYAYEVMGVGYHTEDNCRPEDVNMVVYRPIYESSVYTAGRFFDIRPLEMFMEDITKDGKKMHRFTKITDQKIVEALEKRKQEMYS